MVDKKKSLKTVSGIYVDILEPDPDSLFISDIAHALSYQCRYGGHVNRHYSVAQHSLLCYQILKAYRLHDRKILLTMLMHDATEAYLVDIPRPVKQYLPEYKIIEQNFNRILAKKFGFFQDFPFIIHEIDDLCLQLEIDAIRNQNGQLKITEKPAEATKQEFLEVFCEISGYTDLSS